MQIRRQRFHQSTKIHTIFTRKIKHDTRPIQTVLSLYKLHGQALTTDMTHTNAHRLLVHAPAFFPGLQILLRRTTNHPLNIGNHLDAALHQPNSNPNQGTTTTIHDQFVARPYEQVTRIKPRNRKRPSKTNIHAVHQPALVVPRAAHRSQRLGILRIVDLRVH
jgi:hypothetical protein